MTNNTKKPTRNPAKANDAESKYLASQQIHQEKPEYTAQKYIQEVEDEDWDYAPEGELELPSLLKEWMEDQELAYRWVRFVTENKYDTRNIAKNKKKGYVFLRRDALPQSALEKFDKSSIDSMQDYVTVHDLTLMVSPQWKRDIVKKAIDEKAEAQLRIADDLLRQNVQEREGLELIKETKSKVTGGGTREVDFSKRKASK